MAVVVMHQTFIALTSLILTGPAVPHPINVILEKEIVTTTLIVGETWFVEVMAHPVRQEHQAVSIVVLILQLQLLHHHHLVTL